MRCEMKRNSWMESIIAAALLITAVSAQESLPRRISEAPDGKVAFRYASRPGVYGDGDQIIEGKIHGRWRSELSEGPVQVVLTLKDRDILRLKSSVGGTWPPRSATDLGTVSPAEAADYLLWLAAHEEKEDVGEDAIHAATLAKDVEVWPRLLPLAKDRERPREIRKAAVFWLGQAAGDVVTAQLGDFVEDDDEDLEVRESAVFSLSQRPSDEAIPALSRIARTNSHPKLREEALFWLAQHDDPRVVELFEEILTGG